MSFGDVCIVEDNNIQNGGECDSKICQLKYVSLYSVLPPPPPVNSTL